MGAELGCGVTAIDAGDALGVVRRDLLDGAMMPPVTSLIEDVTFGNLDQDHVVPNIAPTFENRGIWFPMSRGR